MKLKIGVTAIILITFSLVIFHQITLVKATYAEDQPISAPISQPISTPISYPISYPGTLQTALAVGSSIVQVGQSVTVSWNNPSNPSPRDWIGLYVQGDPDNSVDTRYWKEWQYLTLGTCSRNIPATGSTSGSCEFVIPYSVPPGSNYEFRLGSNDTYTMKATSASFTVINPYPTTSFGQKGTSLGLSTSSIQSGQSITVYWYNNVDFLAKDWVGLYVNGDPNAPTNGIKPWKEWYYIQPGQCNSKTAPAVGSVTNSCTFIIPANLPAGQNYEFRLFSNDSYTLKTKSGQFSIHN